MIARDEGCDAPLVALAMLAVLAATSGCDESPVVREFTKTGTNVPGVWSEFFAERKIELQLPHPGPPLLQVGQVAVQREGDLFIPDGRAKRILVFHGDGTLVREIRGGDSGDFKVTVLRAIAVDSQNHLFVFDALGKWLTVLAPPRYAVLHRLQLSHPVADLLAVPGGGVVTYFPADERVFRKFDQAGKQVAATYRVRDENLRIFHGRVQTGGIIQVAGGDLFALHPSAFELVHLSSNLEVLEVFRGAKGDAWAPEPVAFPQGLDPYDYRPPHETWWDSFMHIGRPYALSRDLVVVTVFASRGLSETEEFANIYRTDGRIVAQGLRVPHGGHIVGADHGRLYVARNARFGQGASTEPLEFYEYRLRDTLK